MKKVLVLILVIIIASTLFIGCAGKYENGVYYAQDEVGSRWTYFVKLTVERGKIVDAYWGGTNFVPGGDKRVLSENHEYGMVAYGGAQSYWYEQAEAAEAWLIKNQDPAKFAEFYKDEEGHTDALTTDGGAAVTVHVVEFFDLAAKALAAGPVPEGKYMDVDTVETAELPKDDHGWIYKGDFITVNGTIVYANINPVFANEYEEGSDDAKYFKVDDEGKATPLSKKAMGDDYGMKAYGGAALEWYEQAAAVEAYILENQSLDVELDESGHTDAVAGATIHINEFVDIFDAVFGG